MAKTPAKTAAASRAVKLSDIADDNSSYDIRFGIILDVNGSSVPITSGDIATAVQQGVEFTLQNPVELGTINEFETWVSGQFGVNLPTADSLPSPLDKVVGAITDMKITVEKAHVKVPGTQSTQKSVGVTLEVNGTFQPEINLIEGKLGIQGMVFGFSNEASET